MALISSLFLILSIFCGLLFTYFRFLQEGWTKGKKDIINYRYHILWRKLENNKLQDIPNKVINWLLQIETLSKSIIPKVSQSKYINTDSKKFPIATLVLLLILIIMTFTKLHESDLGHFFWITFMFIIIGSSILKMFAGNDYDNEYIFASIKFNKFIFYLFSIIFSIVITNNAIFIEGKLTSLDSNTKFHIYWINALCDGLTLFATIQIFKYFVRFKRNSLLIVAIIIDLIFASILSFLTLYLITIVTSVELDLLEICYTLIGKSKNGNLWQIEEWFWLMHTTFIPTLIYIFILFLAIMSKTVVIPITKFIGKASVVDKPHYYTATFFGLLGAFFFLLHHIAKLIIS